MKVCQRYDLYDGISMPNRGYDSVEAGSGGFFGSRFAVLDSLTAPWALTDPAVVDLDCTVIRTGDPNDTLLESTLHRFTAKVLDVVRLLDNGLEFHFHETRHTGNRENFEQ